MIAAQLAMARAARLAHASEARGAEIRVTRAPEAMHCRGEQDIAAEVSRLVTRPATQRVEIDVLLRRAGDEYSASVRAQGAVAGQRQLNASGADCRPLEEALVVALALLLDPEARVDVGPERPAAKPRTPPASDAPVAPARAPVSSKPARAQWPLSVRAAIAGAAIDGLVPHLTPGIEAGAALVGRHWSLHGSAGSFVTQSVEFGPGTVDADVALLRLAACLERTWAEDWRAGFCGIGSFGALSGAARSYTTTRAETRPVWAAGLGGRFSGPIVGPLGWMAHLDVLLPLHYESFAIEGVGTAWEMRAVGAWLGLGVDVQIW
jgi:hypothetical protein